MNEILSDLSSPAWWFAVVMVALLVNLAAAYIKLPIDRFMERSSNAWRVRSAARELARQREISALRADRDLLMMYMAGEARSRFNEVRYWVLAAMAILLASMAKGDPLASKFVGLAVLAGVGLAVAFALSERSEANRLAGMVWEAVAPPEAVESSGAGD